MRLEFMKLAENGVTKALPRQPGAVRVYMVVTARPREDGKARA
jgi:hypothetical protein